MWVSLQVVPVPAHFTRPDRNQSSSGVIFDGKTPIFDLFSPLSRISHTYTVYLFWGERFQDFPSYLTTQKNQDLIVQSAMQYQTSVPEQYDCSPLCTLIVGTLEIFKAGPNQRYFLMFSVESTLRKRWM